MPWDIRAGGEDCPFEVVKEDSGEHVACHPTREKAEAHVRAMYANEPEARRGTEFAELMRRFETRTATVENINYKERVITLIAAPYEQPALVEYRGEMWNEIFERTAWNSVVEGAPHRVRVNREHNPNLVCGKAVRFYPERQEGLVADLRVAKTSLGDEALALAEEDCLSASVGFGALRKDQHLDRRTMTRRIQRAYLDHIALVQSPAYVGAEVLSVRDAPLYVPLPPRAPTPDLDAAVRDDILRWADERLNKQ